MHFRHALRHNAPKSYLTIPPRACELQRTWVATEHVSINNKCALDTGSADLAKSAKAAQCASREGHSFPSQHQQSAPSPQWLAERRISSPASQPTELKPRLATVLIILACYVGPASTGSSRGDLNRRPKAEAHFERRLDVRQARGVVPAAQQPTFFVCSSASIGGIAAQTKPHDTLSFRGRHTGCRSTKRQGQAI